MRAALVCVTLLIGQYVSHKRRVKLIVMIHVTHINAARVKQILQHIDKHCNTLLHTATKHSWTDNKTVRLHESHRKLCCSALQCVAVRCSVLQCVAVCCSALQCVAVCCSVLQCVAVCCSVLQCVAVRCSVLQCVAVCCSALQCLLIRLHESHREQVPPAQIYTSTHTHMYTTLFIYIYSKL